MQTKLVHLLGVAVLLTLGISPAFSQVTAGKVQGKITRAGAPVANAQIVLTNTANGRTYKLKTDKDGSFSAIGIAFGQYEQEIVSSTGEKLLTKMTAVAGRNGAPDDLSVDIGESGLSPSDLDLEKLKAQRAIALKENALITQLNSAMESKNWQAAEPILRQLVIMDPGRWAYQQAFGNVELNQGKFQDALTAYEKAIRVAESDLKAGPKTDTARIKEALSQMLTNEGAAYTKLKQPQKAVEAYTRAAELDPNPGMAYFNLCAAQYNTGNTVGAVAACDKAIAADPKRADAYYIKGSILMADSKQSKDGKLIPPAGTVEALNKYLELAPDGPHASDVKQMLVYLGAKVETTYKERQKN